MCHDPKACDEAIDYFDALYADEAQADADYARAQHDQLTAQEQRAQRVVGALTGTREKPSAYACPRGFAPDRYCDAQLRHPDMWGELHCSRCAWRGRDIPQDQRYGHGETVRREP